MGGIMPNVHATYDIAHINDVARHMMTMTTTLKLMMTTMATTMMMLPQTNCICRVDHLAKSGKKEQLGFFVMT